jgi:hypothetical protein
VVSFTPLPLYPWGNIYLLPFVREAERNIEPALTLQITIFWDITPCSPLKVNRRFGGTYRIHLQGRISRATYQHESRWQARIILHNHLCENRSSYMVLALLKRENSPAPTGSRTPTPRSSCS